MGNVSKKGTIGPMKQPLTRYNLSALALNQKANLQAWWKLQNSCSQHLLTTTFETHDNGGRPFRVEITHGSKEALESSKLGVYVDVKEVKVLQDMGDRKFVERENIHNVQKVFIGVDPDSLTFLGNSLLVRSYDKYIFIGTEIYEFSSPEPILFLCSPVGPNDVSYPVALSSTFIYFMVERIYVMKEELMQLARRDYRHVPLSPPSDWLWWCTNAYKLLMQYSANRFHASRLRTEKPLDKLSVLVKRDGE
jgi:hypothetical protein